MRVDIDIVSLIICTIFIIKKIIQDNNLAIWDREDWVVYQIVAFIMVIYQIGAFITVIYQIMAFITILCISLKACWELRKIGRWRTCVMFKR